MRKARKADGTNKQQTGAAAAAACGLAPRPEPSPPAAGNFLGFRSFVYAPVNEYGVIYLFGMVASELGFVVESLGRGFPDCIARRRAGPGRWAPVWIEFEVRSRNFLLHRHDAALCDLIVCWEHDWPDCPVEVLELRRTIRRIDAADFWDERRGP